MVCTHHSTQASNLNRVFELFVCFSLHRWKHWSSFFSYLHHKQKHTNIHVCIFLLDVCLFSPLIARFTRARTGHSDTQACSWTVNTDSVRVPFVSAKRPWVTRTWWAPTAPQCYSSLRGLNHRQAPTRTLCKPQGHNGHRVTKCVLLSSLHFLLSFPFWLLLSFSTSS